MTLSLENSLSNSQEVPPSCSATLTFNAEVPAGESACFDSKILDPKNFLTDVDTETHPEPLFQIKKKKTSDALPPLPAFDKMYTEDSCNWLHDEKPFYESPVDANGPAFPIITLSSRLKSVRTSSTLEVPSSMRSSLDSKRSSDHRRMQNAPIDGLLSPIEQYFNKTVLPTASLNMSSHRSSSLRRDSKENPTSSRPSVNGPTVDSDKLPYVFTEEFFGDSFREIDNSIHKRNNSRGTYSSIS
ncbi:hypothetical protein AGDE_16994 [Angomonas deanei]|nr:hypothetical protein AGDE_16994 [Angomonas deanei]|eukprot:EPY15727.1 hypothetical protein AGDE_16994 [Angomonas deanei]